MVRFILFFCLSPLLVFGAEGLLGTYYSSNDFTNQTGQRTDTTINFEWGSSRPVGMVDNSNNFSIIWEGYLIVPETADYTFHAAHDDRFEFILNNHSYYNNNTWTGGANNYSTFTINNLQEGYHPIKLRFIENSGGAYMKLAWSNSASINNRTIIPSQNLSTEEPPRGYCAQNDMLNGFHVINPNVDVNQSFEIFCYEKRDYIALPNKNDFNNLVFNSNTLSNTDYYEQAEDHSSHFEAIEIDATTMEVIPSKNASTPQDIGNFKAMGSTFSNINLIGTPFAIDWAQTNISNCTENKLRKAYYGQAVKINTLNYDNAICQIDEMKLKLLDDYTYLTYNEEEVLENTCKLMAEAVPENILAGEDIRGHYWIKPNNNDRSHENNDITKATERPLVAYCWYQTDLDWAWTFLLAMDGERTTRKSDLTDRADSCSKMGLFPFVPNTEDTFTRVRLFLKNNKSQWDNYTGTIQEKVNALYNNNYYLSTERNQLIWPYGSFGVYYPTNGNGSVWRGPNDSNPGQMSGSPMHNSQTIITDYDRYRDDDRNDDFYSYGRYSNTDTIDAPLNRYEYKDTMGAKGWVSILGESDLNKTEEWFISRSGAGENITGTTVYFEPNGNYSGGCWLNYLFDDEGRVRHNDDWNCNYPYYDYMCMAEDNYDFTQRYSLIKGRFSVVEKGISDQDLLDEANRIIQTKIVGQNFLLDGILLNSTETALAQDENISFGLFLAQVDTIGGNEVDSELKFIGENLDVSSGRFDVNITGLNVPGQAYKKLFFRFKFCEVDGMEWKQCWNSGVGGSKSDSRFAQTSESDFFAVRPNKFDLTFDPNPSKKIAEENYDITFKALDAGNTATIDYNEPVPFFHEETNPSCTAGVFNPMPSMLVFSDGEVAGAGISYNEAGKINIKIKEESGTEFAIVDSGDTPDIMRLITPYDANISFIPDSFDINASLTQGGNNFVYINSDINTSNGKMSAIFDVNITARGASGTKLLNYSDLCYAKDSNLTLSFQIPIINPAGGLTRVLVHETNTSRDFNTNITDSNITLTSLSKSIFNNGDADLTLRVNFDRNMSAAVQPFKLNATSFDIEDDDNVSGTLNLTDFNSTFYYGRVDAPDYENVSPIAATIYYEVYCDDCNRTEFNITGPVSKQGLPWFINEHHDNTDQGHVKTFSSVGSTVLSKTETGNDNNITDGNETILLTYDSDGVDRIKMEPDPWLLYNQFDENATYNDFMVTFFLRGEWAGGGTVEKEGDEFKIGTTLEDNTTSMRSNRRISW